MAPDYTVQVCREGDVVHPLPCERMNWAGGFASNPPKPLAPARLDLHGIPIIPTSIFAPTKLNEASGPLHLGAFQSCEISGGNVAQTACKTLADFWKVLQVSRQFLSEKFDQRQGLMIQVNWTFEGKPARASVRVQLGSCLVGMSMRVEVYGKCLRMSWRAFREAREKFLGETVPATPIGRVR